MEYNKDGTVIIASGYVMISLTSKLSTSLAFNHKLKSKCGVH